ncbi:hypothetical protein ABZS44_13025 [Micromonospora sediminicola]|uniref:hypothetical protein n=1 Tax=Micromonospora sediminicola TaxID=946078 RepID=UPI0033A5063C
MSFAGELRRVRDESQPFARRVAAFRRCLGMYAPFGFTSTLSHLEHRFGPMEDADKLTSAAEALATSRQAWLADLTRWHQSRRDAKARGRRHPAEHERSVYLSRQWPGGGHTTGPATSSGHGVVSVGFLATHGVVPASAIEQWRVHQKLAGRTVVVERRRPITAVLVWTAIAAAVISVLVLSTISGWRPDPTGLLVASGSVASAFLLHHMVGWALKR